MLFMAPTHHFVGNLQLLGDTLGSGHLFDDGIKAGLRLLVQVGQICPKSTVQISAAHSADR